MTTHSTEEIKIFCETKRVNLVNRPEMYIRVHSSYNEEPVATVSVTGLFLPEHQILIIKQDAQRAVSTFNMTSAFTNLVPRRTVSYVLDLAGAARECIRYTDTLFRELDQIANPSLITNTQTTGGSPYRSLPSGSKLLGS